MKLAIMFVLGLTAVGTSAIDNTTVPHTPASFEELQVSQMSPSGISASDDSRITTGIGCPVGCVKRWWGCDCGDITDVTQGYEVSVGCEEDQMVADASLVSSPALGAEGANVFGRCPWGCFYLPVVGCVCIEEGLV